MIRMKTPSAISRWLENKAVMITVQRITVVINRRRNTCAFEGIWVTTAVSDISQKLTGQPAVANPDLFRLGTLSGVNLAAALPESFRKRRSAAVPAAARSTILKPMNLCIDPKIGAAACRTPALLSLRATHLGHCSPSPFHLTVAPDPFFGKIVSG